MRLKARLRRPLYFLVAFVWLVVMCFPVFAFALAVRGEIKIGKDGGNNVRLFLLQETGTEGIGITWTRTETEPGNCLQVRQRYFLWQGDSSQQNIDYCLCPDDIQGYKSATSSCEAPSDTR